MKKLIEIEGYNLIQVLKKSEEKKKSKIVRYKTDEGAETVLTGADRMNLAMEVEAYNGRGKEYNKD